MSAQGQTGKRIQDYVYNYSDFLGQGNFSKCYRATNTITRTAPSTQNKLLPSKSSLLTPSSPVDSRSCSTLRSKC